MKPELKPTGPTPERTEAAPHLRVGLGHAAVVTTVERPLSSPDVQPGHLQLVCRLAGTIAIVVGGYHFAAWLTGSAERWTTSVITMKTNAALTFVLAGSALLLLLGQGRAPVWRRAAGVITSVLVFLIGAATLCEHLFQADFGLDQLFATEVAGAVGTGSPNRMGPPASTSFAVLGLGLIALAWKRWRSVAPYFGLVTCFISLVPAVGYVFGIGAFYGRANLTETAWPTVVALLSLGVGMMLAARDSGPVAAVLRADAGGTFLRAVLGWTLLIPLALGYLFVQAERASVFDMATGTGTLVITLVLFFSMFLWRSATRIGDAVAAQGQAYEALRESDARAGAAHERLRIHVEATPLALIEWDSEYRLTGFSNRAQQMFGWTAGEVVGRRIDEIPWVPEEDWPSIRPLIQDMTSGARPTTFSANRNLRKDGSIIHCEWYNSTLIDDAGHTVSILSLVLDVTDRKRAEEALRLSEGSARARAAELEAVLDTVPAAVWIAHDEQANDVTANRFGAELLRAPRRANISVTAPPEARPQNFRVMKDGREIDPDDLPIQAAARFGKEFRQYEFDLLFDDGTVRHLLGNSSPLRGERGAPNGSVGAFIDITERKEAEARSESLARFPEESPDPVLRLDRDCVVIYANEVACARMSPLGVTRGAPVAADIAGPARQALAEGNRVQCEVSCSGTVFSIILVPVANEVNVYAHDVTSRKRAEGALRESEQRYRTMGETLPYGVWLCNPDGRVEYASQSFLDLVEMTHDELLEHGWTHRLPPEDVQPMLESWLQSVRTGARWDAEHRILGPDGKYHHVLARGLPVRDQDGKITCWVGINLDIDERKTAEEKIRSSDRRKTEFLAMLSHELRNPLAPIRNSVYLLERAAPGTEQAARARDVIRRQTEHLTRLVDDLLDMTRISRGKIALQRSRVDLREVVRKVTDDLLFLFEQSGVELRFEQVAGPVWVEADGIRIAQVVANLLQNAVKFTPEAGTVTVDTRASQGRAEIRVRDTGVGIDPDQVERMFEPFAQAEQNLARTQGGLGLGLSLVKALVELHGGTVSARSEGAGRGSEFVVSLALATAGAAPPKQLSAAANGNRRLILIIEDNVDAGQSLADILELGGHTVRLARDGRSGVALARELKPDVVLCDIGLPDIDGYEVVRMLRRDDALRRTRIIALSGYAQPEDVQRAKAAGFDAHLPKPAPLDKVAEILALDRRPGSS